MAFAAAAAAGSLISGIMSAQGQQAGAAQAASAANAGAANINAATQQAAGNYHPYLQEGSSAAQLLQNQLPTLTQNFNPTVAQMDATPGFQFMQQQGLQAIQSKMASEGLIGSGAEGKALANYATQNALSNYSAVGNLYNQGRMISLNGLTNATQIGSGAANNLGQLLVGGASKAAGLTAQAGQDLGAGTAGAANAYGNIASNALGNISGTSMYEQLYGNPLASILPGGNSGGGGGFSNIPGNMMYSPGNSNILPIGNGNSVNPGFIMS